VGTVKPRTFLVGVADGEHIDVVVLEEAVVSPSSTSMLTATIITPLSLSAAASGSGKASPERKRTPGRPEIQHDDLPAKLAEVILRSASCRVKSGAFAPIRAAGCHCSSRSGLRVVHHDDSPRHSAIISKSD